MSGTDHQGTVIAGGGGLYRVKVGEATLTCSLRGRLRREGSGASRLFIGDLVRVSLIGPDRGVIEGVLPRTAAWTRLDPLLPLGHTTAVNVQLAVIVLAAREPRFNIQTVERYLVQARSGGLEPVVCINKIDLAADRGDLVREATDLHEAGVAVHLTSTVTGEGLADLAATLLGRSSVFLGPSGVGKTSLLNALRPDAGLAIGAVSRTGKGRHTTTAATAVQLDSGLAIDTPGQRTLGLWGAGEDDLASTFPEVAALAETCRFRDCTHTHEPGCAVKAAVESGKVDERRYRHYVRLQKGLVGQGRKPG
ncbi:MAG: ribosome small subunit-dependent GTPase A [Bacillota bacterium]